MYITLNFREARMIVLRKNTTCNESKCPSLMFLAIDLRDKLSPIEMGITTLFFFSRSTVWDPWQKFYMFFLFFYFIF